MFVYLSGKYFFCTLFYNYFPKIYFQLTSTFLDTIIILYLTFATLENNSKTIHYIKKIKKSYIFYIKLK